MTTSNQVYSTPEGNSVTSSTPRSVQVSTAAITTTATVTTSATSRGPVDLASFEIVGTTFEVVSSMGVQFLLLCPPHLLLVALRGLGEISKDTLLWSCYDF